MRLLEATLLEFGIKAVPPETDEYLGDMGSMAVNVRGEDENIIQIDHNVYLENVPEDLIHVTLEHCWSIA